MRFLFLLALFITLATIVNAQKPKLEWGKQMGGKYSDGGYGITLDESGNIYTTGYFEENGDFDPGPGIFNLKGYPMGDIFVSKFDASGNFLWAKALGGNFTDIGKSIAVDNSGNVYVTGFFSRTADFNPDSLQIFELTSKGGADIFVLKLDAFGKFVWAKSFGDSDVDEAKSIKIDRSGNIYFTGTFQGIVDFNPDSIGTFYLSSTDTFGIFISKLDANGNFKWAKNIGSKKMDYEFSIAFDSMDNIYTSGSFQGTVDLNPGSGTFNISSSGSNDVFISKFDSSGKFIWAKTFGGTLTDRAFSIVTNKIGEVFTIGTFKGTVDFDPGPGTSKLTSNGAEDIFIIKLSSSGNFVWVKQIGGNLEDGGTSILKDAIGNIYIAGFFNDKVDFDPDLGVSYLTSTTYSNRFISKLDEFGKFVWAENLGSIWFSTGQSIVVDASSNIFCTGIFSGKTDFDPNPTKNFDLTALGIEDIFFLKLSKGTDGIKVIDKNQISLYPNPNNGILNLEIYQSTNDGHFEIYNCLGVLIYKMRFLYTLNTIDLTNYSKGLYYIKIIFDDKIVAIEKIIKQ